ncbi:MAG: phage portal protein [Ilumatobacteraceae bacterium]
MFRRLFTQSESERDLSYQQIWGAGGDWVSGNMTWAGADISQRSSLQLSAVYACVRLLADTISTLPADTYTRSGDERRPYPQPLWVTEPDVGVTRQDFLQQVVTSMLLDGNAFIQVLRGGTGTVAALVVLDPTRIEVRRNRETRRPEYVVDQGQATLSADDVLHITDLRRPGDLRGISRVTELRQTLGLARALDEFAARFFGNGSTTSGIIEYPGNLNREQAKDLVDGFEAAHKGLRKAHRPGVLSGGATFKKTGVDPDSAQMLGSRQMSVEEIARIFGIPPHMIGLTTPGAMSYASVEQNAIQFVTHTLRPMVTKIESALSRLLPGDAFLRFNMDGLLRGDSISRAQYHSTALQAGWETVNDVRRIEDLPPIDGGDQIRVPLANIEINAASLVELDKRVIMAQRLVVSGFEPSSVLEALGLPQMSHTGLPSVQLQGIAQIDPNNPEAVYPVAGG